MDSSIRRLDRTGEPPPRCMPLLAPRLNCSFNAEDQDRGGPRHLRSPQSRACLPLKRREGIGERVEDIDGNHARAFLSSASQCLICSGLSNQYSSMSGTDSNSTTSGQGRRGLTSFPSWPKTLSCNRSPRPSSEVVSTVQLSDDGDQLFDRGGALFSQVRP